MNLVNWAEVLSVTVREGGSVQAIREQLFDAGVLGENGLLSLVPITEADAEFAADLIMVTARAGLSLGDRLCLATAHRLRLPVLTGDQSWSTLPLPGIQVQLIR
jgi:PIN domain nuclease of toxin-antitoxin system